MPLQLTVQKVDGKPGAVYYPLKLSEVPRPTPGPDEYVVRLHAASLNHRDLFIRQHLYPGISFANPLLSDGHGTVVAAGPGADPSLIGTQVILNPCRGWLSDPDAPEDGGARFSAIGGVRMYPQGTGQDYVALPASEVEPCPPHLTPPQAAALPLCGLTAWRALVTKCGRHASPGSNILITGIGGGVALAALQFAVARGCTVYVTSSDPSKVRRATDDLGAAGGVSYRDADWDGRLLALLPKDRPLIDCIIDGAGGDIVRRAMKVLRPGGVIASYGMTVAPKMDWLMQAVLRHVELRAATMGSRAEFGAMVEFVRRERIVPVVSRTVQGLTIQGMDSLFDDMKAGRQFGKLVVEISPVGSEQSSSNL